MKRRPRSGHCRCLGSLRLKNCWICWSISTVVADLSNLTINIIVLDLKTTTKGGSRTGDMVLDSTFHQECWLQRGGPFKAGVAVGTGEALRRRWIASIRDPQTCLAAELWRWMCLKIGHRRAAGHPKNPWVYHGLSFIILPIQVAMWMYTPSMDEFDFRTVAKPCKTQMSENGNLVASSWIILSWILLWWPVESNFSLWVAG